MASCEEELVDPFPWWIPRAATMRWQLKRCLGCPAFIGLQFKRQRAQAIYPEKLRFLCDFVVMEAYLCQGSVPGDTKLDVRWGPTTRCLRHGEPVPPLATLEKRGIIPRPEKVVSSDAVPGLRASRPEVKASKGKKKGVQSSLDQFL